MPKTVFLLILLGREWITVSHVAMREARVEVPVGVTFGPEDVVLVGYFPLTAHEGAV